MILERKTGFNHESLESAYGGIFERLRNERGIDAISLMKGFGELQHTYSAAMNEISTKLEILDDEFQLKHMHNPIHHIENRLKSPQSILAKIERKKLPLDMDAIRGNLYDIAGVRVICNYTDDVYAISNLITKQSDIQLIRKKDYIKQPKANGYRSLHLVVTVPVFLAQDTVVVPVEIQLRTIAMDYWACLEHKLKYKNNNENIAVHQSDLVECSDQLAKIEAVMLNIHRDINN